MDPELNILIIEDAEDDAHLVVRAVERGGYRVNYTRVQTADGLRAALDRRGWDAILSDYAMPGFSGAEALRILKEKYLDTPFIVVSGTISEEAAVEMMKSGAHDYFSKNKTARLVPAIEREMREAEGRQRRREAERRLQQSERRFRLLSENTSDIITLHQPDGITVYASPACERVLGYAPEELVGNDPYELIHPDDVESARAGFRKRAFAGVVGPPVQSRFRHKNGAYIWLETQVDPILNDDGRVDHVVNSSRDITERRKLLQQLDILHRMDQAILRAASRQALARVAIEHLDHLIPFDWASVAEFDYEAAAVHVPYGRQPADAEAAHFPTNLTDWVEYLREGRSLVAENIQQTGSLGPIDTAFRRAGVRCCAVIPLITEGNLIGSFNLGTKAPGALTTEHIEIGEHVAAQLAIGIRQMQLYEEVSRHADQLEQRVEQRTMELNRTMERTEAILNNSGDAIVVVGPEGAIRQVNRAFYDLFGFDEAQIIGENIERLVNAPDVAKLKATLGAVTTGGASNRVEVAAAGRDRTAFSAEVTLSAIGDGQAQEVVCSFHDVTERKREEETLRAALAKEKELNELKSRFVSMVSHEFRTPLATIKLAAEFLERYHERLDENQRLDRLRRIQTQVEHLTTMMEDILAIGQHEAVGFSLNPQPLDLEQVCQATAEEQRAITGASHQINFRRAGPCPEIVGDPNLLKRAVTNLVSNAVKYSPPGSTVQIVLQCEARHADIHVIDEGIGIPGEDQEHLFEVFHRASNVGDRPGTGLGLTIVRQIIEAHGGTLTYDSAQNIGTTFTIRLPALNNAQA